ncbi:hypothetical protein SBF1_660014 [Candidatus Desulfosporosinus infrequens]|uniref:Uncharacterized protein n=1 Tax=Candidatus Desulfosporosinus infrequens TaxID=2043169 RepID=A0A2U3LN73_9FIRM|nr:hypothetical protein SBF1_660014 [Candidatus Desulfosporosinus infrequens]
MHTLVEDNLGTGIVASGNFELGA